MSLKSFEFKKGTTYAGPYNRGGTAHNMYFSKDVILKSVSLGYVFPNGSGNIGINLRIYELQGNTAKIGNSILVFDKAMGFYFNNQNAVDCLFDDIFVKLKANTYYGFVFYAPSNGIADAWSNPILNPYTIDDLTLRVGTLNMYANDYLGGTQSSWGGQSNIGNFSIVVDDEIKTEKKILISHDGKLKKYSNGWVEVGQSPGAKELYDNQGMVDISSIPLTALRQLTGDVRVLAYTEKDKVFKANIETEQVFNLIDKNYRGTATIETKEEVLPASRKTLWINADHTGCLFSYSLDSGSTWTAFVPGDILDISSKVGTAFKVKINLQNDDARLDALAYAWA